MKLKTLTSEIKRMLKDNLVSLIVFGSYARGDFNKNSDIDLIVVLKKKTKGIVARLMKLEEKLSIKANSWIERKISLFLNSIGFKKNIFIFDEEEFKKQKFNFCDSRLLSWLLIPKGVIWSNIKKDGKVIYGKDLIKEIKPKVTIWDKIKAPLPGIGACFFATLVLLFNREKAIQLAQTGLRWTYMNALGVLRRSNINSVFGNLLHILKISLGLVRA